MDAVSYDAAARALLDGGDVEGAVEVLRQGQERTPHPVLATNLGRLTWRRGDLERGLELLEWAAATAPDSAAAWLNLGDARVAAGDPSGEHAYRRALHLADRPAAIHWSIALDLLTRGQWARAWPHYAWRPLHPEVRQRRAPYPHLWDRPEPGGRILLWSNEGVGEDLRHAALLPMLLAAGYAIVLEIDPRLVALFQRSFPDVQVVPRAWPPGSETTRRDIVAHCALGDLPPFLRLDPRHLPVGRPWLRADPARVRALRTRYAEWGAPLVGLSWQSRTTPFAEAKSVGLAAFAPLLAAGSSLPGAGGAAFVDLQYAAAEAERARLPTALAARLHRDSAIDPMVDLDGFAAQVAALDLVVSSSNTTVHMAGALGVPVWTMVHCGPPITPYWLAESAGSPWYPTMRVWRQDRPGNWSQPLSGIMDGFRAWILARAGHPGT